MFEPGLTSRVRHFQHWKIEGGWVSVAVFAVGLAFALDGVWAWSHSTLAQLPVVLVALYVRLHLDWGRLDGMRRLANMPKWPNDWAALALAGGFYLLARHFLHRAGYHGDPLLLIYLGVVFASAFFIVLLLGLARWRRHGAA